MSVRTGLLVIGAGPYAYAAAACARRHGIDTHGTGRPMAFWRDQMPADMFLRSGVDWHLDAAEEDTFVAFLDGCALAPLELHPIPLRVFENYTEWFRQRQALTIDERLVADLVEHDGSFVAPMDDGSM